MARQFPHNMILGWQNCVTAAATITGNWANGAGLRSWYLGDEAVSQASGTGPHSLSVSWAAPQPMDLVMLYGHTLAEDSSVRITLYNKGSMVADSGTMPAYVPAPIGYIPWGDSRFWGHMLGPWDRRWGWVLDGLVWADRLDVTLTGSGFDGGAVALPIFYAGPSWQVSANYDYGSAWGQYAAAEVQGADWGSPLADGDVEPRFFTGTLSHLSEGEVRGRLRELLMHTARGKAPFLALPEPGSAFGIMTQTLLGFLPDLPSVQRSASVRDEWVCELNIREWLA
jgi:hypothetical protein